MRWRIRTHYYSTSSDADRDGNGQIGALEATPPAIPDLLEIRAANARYRRLGTVREIQLQSQNGRQVATFDSAPSNFFYRNDLAVTINSSRYLPAFTELRSYTDSNGRNHTTIKQPAIAADVLQKIREAEGSQ